MRFSNISRFKAVASRSIDTARVFAQKHHIPTAYAQYDDLLDDPQIDIVYIPLPNHLHAEWTIKALNSGKHVLCEKPLALSLNDIGLIQDAVKSSGRVAAEAFMYRHHPQTLKIQELVRSGILGEIKLIHASFGFFLDQPGDIRQFPDYGGGCLWDVGCYPVSLSRLIAGNAPDTVWGNQVIGKSGIDEIFCGQMVFQGNIIAQVDSSFQAQYFTSAEIRGSEGTLLIPEPFKMGSKSILTIKLGNGEKTISFFSENLYIGEIIDMEQAVLDQKPPRISLSDSLDNTRTILGLYKSAQSGNPVSI